MEYPVFNYKQETAPSASWVRCIASVVAAVVMLVLCWPGIAQASAALDDWRASVVRVRLLAENDVPRADQEALRLQAQLPADATPVDRARLLNLRSRIEVYLAQPEAAASHAQQALELARQQEDRVGQAEAYLNLTLTSVNQGKMDVLADAAPRTLEALQGVDRPDLLGEAMLRVAMMYLRFGQLDEAVTLCMQAMDIAKRNGNSMAQLYAHQGLGVTFLQNDRYVQAREHYTQMRDLARTLQVKQLEAEATSGLSSSIGALGDRNAAMSLQREALSLYRSAGAPFYIAHGLYSLADSQRQQGMLMQSLRSLDEVIAIYERYPNKIGLWWTLMARSENLQALGRLALAKSDAERAYALAQQLDVLLYRSESAKRMAAVLSALGEHQRAYQLSAQALELAGKITREKGNARVAELASNYQNDSKQRKIDELNLLDQQRKLEQRWLWSVLGGSMLVLALAVGFLLRLRRSHRLLEIANAQLRQSQEDIRALNTDLEQRVQTRTDELRQQTRYLRTLIDALPVWLWLKDTGGRYLAVNGRTAALHGHTPQQMVGKTDAELMPGEVAESFRATDIEVLQTRQRKTWEQAIPGKEGNVSWHETDKLPVIDMDDTVLGTVGIGRDITERKRMEDELAQRERDFRSLAENMPDNVIRWDVDGRYLYLNPVHERTHGASASDMIGKAIPDSHVNVKAAIAQVVSTGQAVLMVQQPVPDEHGEMRLHDVNLVPERDEAGKIVSVLGIGRDMTDVYRMREAIATREQAFRSLAESSPDFIVRYDREGRHLYFNDHLLHHLGLASADEAIGKRPSEVWPDGRFAELEQVVARAMESGNQGNIEIVEPTERSAFRYHQIFVVPERDVTGQVIGAIAFGREITAIREAEHKLAHFIDNLPGMAYTFRTSPEGRGSFPYVSPAIDELYGLKPEDVKDDMAPIHALAHPDDRPRIEAASAESARTMRPFQIEFRICRKDEPERWIDVHSVPERQADGSLLWYGMMLDITERKRAQVELQRSERELRRQAQFQQSLLSTLIDAGVVLCVVENGKFVYTNDHYLGCQLGYAKGQMPATVGFIDLIHPDDRPRIAEMYRNRLAGKPLPSSYEIGALGGDGSRLDYEFHVTTVPGTDPVQTLVFALNIAERKRAEDVLRFIAQGKWLNRGELFLNALVRYLGQMLNVDCVSIDKIAADPAYAETVARYARGELVPNRRYALEGTPCANALSEGLCSFPENVQGQFPDDDLLVEMQAESYVGLALWDTEGNVIGLIAVLDGKPMGDTSQVKSILQLVATSAAAELKRSQMEQVLRESHESLSEAQRISHVGNWELDLVSRALHWSDEIYRIFEIEPEQFGTSYDAFLNAAHPDDREAVDRAYTDAVKNNTPYEIEHRLLLANGQIKHVHERCETVYDQDGKALRSIGTVQDITERKHLENELKQREREFRTLAENAPDNIVRYDKAGRIVYVNPVLERTLGIPAAFILGTRVRDNHSDGTFDAYADTLDKVLASGEHGEIEVALPDGVDGPKVHHIRMVAERNEAGDMTGVLAIGRDITELKRYEAARDEALAEAVRLAKARSEFLAQMSHELRTPLNGILGYTQILQQDKDLGERNADALKVMRQSGEHLLALIEDILDLARIEAGRLTLDVGEISLDSFLRGVADIVSVRALEKGIEFCCDFSDDLPTDIHTDEKRLRQVLLNLLSNAVKFTHQGRVVLHVSRVDASRLAFMVEDTGVGIAANELESIFQPFEQSGDARQRFGGSGLGLSISRQLMHLMGGDIWAESRLGVGSRFGFELELPISSAVSWPVFAVPDVDRRSQQLGRKPSVEVLDKRMVAPPAEELRALFQLAQLGNMRDILQFAQHIAGLDAQYQPFAAHLQQMAQGYQSKAILAWVSMYFKDASSE